MKRWEWRAVELERPTAGWAGWLEHFENEGWGVFTIVGMPEGIAVILRRAAR